MRRPADESPPEFKECQRDGRLLGDILVEGYEFSQIDREASVFVFAERVEPE
jgi:hypothetical protein